MSNLTVKDTQARKRLASLFDDGVFTEIDAFAKSANGDAEAVAGFGSVNGTCVYAFSQDVTADSGAISVAQWLKGSGGGGLLSSWGEKEFSPASPITPTPPKLSKNGGWWNMRSLPGTTVMTVILKRGQFCSLLRLGRDVWQ